MKKKVAIVVAVVDALVKTKNVKIREGGIAIDFRLPDQEGKIHQLSDYKGRWILLYFYPRDNTPGCTKEALNIKNHFADFQKLNILVFGISVDSIESHKKFAEKYNIPFSLLSDSKKEIVKKYGVWQKKKLMGNIYMGVKRTSFLISPDFKIVKIYYNVKPEIHAKEVLQDLTYFLGQ